MQSEINIGLTINFLGAVLGAFLTYYCFKEFVVTSDQKPKKLNWLPFHLILVALILSFYLPQLIGVILHQNEMFYFETDNIVPNAQYIKLIIYVLLGFFLYFWYSKVGKKLIELSKISFSDSPQTSKLIYGWLISLISIFLIAFVARSSPEFGLSILITVIFAPIVEEWLCRGFLYTYLNQFSGKWEAALTSSILFSIIHMQLEGFLQRVLIGLILCYSFERSNRFIGIPIVIHAAINLLMLYLQRYVVSP